jgi:hypothetical protein
VTTFPRFQSLDRIASSGTSVKKFEKVVLLVMMENKKDLMQQLCEDAGYNVRSYSGRHMYGKSCLAVVFDGDLGRDFVADIIDELGNNIQDDDPNIHGIIADAFRGICEDQMGLGRVLYFPNIPYVGSDVDEEMEDEEVSNI